MYATIVNKEVSIIRNIAGDFPRHPLQVNALMEADAEIIRQHGNIDEYLVLKTDGIYEEIKEKLYQDPYLIGWMTVTAPMSDIAAVGAQPTGVLLSLVLPSDHNPAWLKQLKSGINDACKAYNTYILGGDTNFDNNFSAGATIVATIKGHKPLLRKGVKAGEYLYASAFLGLGNAYAYSLLFDAAFQIKYQPSARLDESKIIRNYASACIDTSDGLFPALSILSEMNETGFNLTIPLQSILHPLILPVQHHSVLPAWMFMAGPHGEYELLFTIPKESHKKFKVACENENWQPVLLGESISEISLYFSSESLDVQCHPATIANLYYEAGNYRSYLELLRHQHKSWTNQNLEL